MVELRELRSYRFTEIAAVLNLSVVRIGQIHRRAMMKIRAQRRNLEKYLEAT